MPGGPSGSLDAERLAAFGIGAGADLGGGVELLVEDLRLDVLLGHHHRDEEFGGGVVELVLRLRRLAVEELDRTCLDRIARFKRPKDYRFVPALPTNSYGKVLKRELREQLAGER